MDISELQTRITEFMLNQTQSGACGPEALAALRQDLEAAIAAHGEAVPQLRELAEALDMMAGVMSDSGYAEAIAEQAMKDYVPNPPIFDAIDDGDVAAVEAALGAWDVNATHGEFEASALYHAMSCMFGLSLPVVTLLLDRGADPRIGLGETSNVLHGLGFGICDKVAPEELAKIVRRCVALGADIEQRSNKLGWTPLITAASEWNPVAVEALLLAGADIQARAGNIEGVCFAGETALAFAEGHGPTHTVLKRFLRVA